MKNVKIKFRKFSGTVDFKLAETILDIESFKDSHVTFYIFVKCIFKEAIYINTHHSCCFVTNEMNPVYIQAGNSKIAQFLKCVIINQNTYLIPVRYNGKLFFNEHCYIINISNKSYISYETAQP